MKKWSLLLTFFLFASCGVQIDDQNGKREGESIGEVRGLKAENFDTRSTFILNDICNALYVKQQNFEDIYVDQSRSLSFVVSKKSCSETEGTSETISLRLKSVSGKIEFVSDTATDFFRTYETKTQGKIAEFCAILTSGQAVPATKAISGASFADWYSVSDKPAICGEQNSSCFIFERGERLGGAGNYRITQFEKIVVNTKNYDPKRGVVIRREKVDNFGCAVGDVNFLKSRINL